MNNNNHRYQSTTNNPSTPPSPPNNTTLITSATITNTIKKSLGKLNTDDADHQLLQFNDYLDALGGVDYDDIFEKEIGTIIEKRNVRIDRPGYTRVNGRKYKVLEGHVVGVKENSIISRVLFSETLKVGDLANQGVVLGYIEKAMYDSFLTGKVYTVVSN
ncbi:hypothetical protein ACTFIW_011651 [Dictyostelium discoideum]